jgi:hypothetical protein
MSRRCASAPPDRPWKRPTSNFDNALSTENLAFSALQDDAASVWHTGCLREKNNSRPQGIAGNGSFIAGMRTKI